MASVTARESPARRAWSHEVCRASNSALAYMASVTAREEADIKEEKDTIRQVIFNSQALPTKRGEGPS